MSWTAATARCSCSTNRTTHILEWGSSGTDESRCQFKNPTVKAHDTFMSQQLRRNGISLFHGRARFRNTTVIEMQTVDGGCQQFMAEPIVLATGSRPRSPEEIPVDHEHILDSDSLLSMLYLPQSLTVVGGGVIGCEYASIFCNLDVKVNLVNTRDRLLSFLDDEITDALGYHLRHQGTVIRHNEVCDRVEALEDGVVMHCRSGKKFKTV